MFRSRNYIGLGRISVAEKKCVGMNNLIFTECFLFHTYVSYMYLPMVFWSVEKTYNEIRDEIANRYRDGTRRKSEYEWKIS